MQAFQKWLANTPLGTASKTFVAMIIGSAIADWASHGEISLSSWQPWVISAAVSSIPPVLNWLNPQYTSYGRGSE